MIRPSPGFQLSCSVSRGDWQIPLFTNFILHKYRDIKERDPESAKKIERRIFTESFLLNVLNKGVDELYVIVKTLTGKADENTRKVLDHLAPPGEVFDSAMGIFNSGEAMSALPLELACGHCGDINDYENRFTLA